MDLKEIRKIVELMNDHGLTLFHLEKEDFNLKLKKGADVEVLKEALSVMSWQGPAPQAPPSVPPGPALAGPDDPPVDNGRALTSPMVGTYYCKPAPDAEPFVTVGDTVSEGQTLCIIEAMKVMNEIKAEMRGTIIEICVEDSTPVQFGDLLFRLK